MPANLKMIGLLQDDLFEINKPNIHKAYMKLISDLQFALHALLPNCMQHQWTMPGILTLVPAVINIEESFSSVHDNTLCCGGGLPLPPTAI